MKQKEKESDCIFWKFFLIWIQNSSFPKTKSTTFSYFSFSLLTRADVWVHWPGLLFSRVFNLCITNRWSMTYTYTHSLSSLTWADVFACKYTQVVVFRVFQGEHIHTSRAKTGKVTPHLFVGVDFAGKSAKTKSGERILFWRGKKRNARALWARIEKKTE